MSATEEEADMSKDLKYLFAGVSLVTLALGFSLLGILSFVYQAQGYSATVSDLENNYSYLGSGVSIFAGAIFFAAARAYWKRR